MDIFYEINNKLNNDNLIDTKKLLDLIDVNNLKNIKSYNSLLLRYYIKINDHKMIKYIISNKNLMKRDYLLYCSFEKDIEKCIYIINIMLKKDEIQDKDIDYIIKNCPHILYLLDGYYCKTTNKSNITNFSIFKKYNIDDIKDNIITFYKKKIYNNIDKCLDNYDIILDGGNIIYFNTKGKEPNYNNLLRILKLLKNKNPLIIIHEKHMKKKFNAINILKTKYLENILITPYQTYDDYYIIYSMIKRGIPVISNDKYKDHIYDMFKILYKDNVQHFNKVSNYIKDNIITYSLNRINYNQYHYNFSRCIQYIDNSIYIPTKESFYKN